MALHKFHINNDLEFTEELHDSIGVEFLQVLLGGLLTNPSFPEPCFDLSEMQRRNSDMAKRLVQE